MNSAPVDVSHITARKPIGDPRHVGYIYVPPGATVSLLGLNIEITSGLNVELNAYPKMGLLGTVLGGLAGDPASAAINAATPTVPQNNRVNVPGA